MQNDCVSTSPNIDQNSTNETLIRVLCVDDETSLLESTKSILELQTSFQIETASSADEALQKIRRKEFDVIVSDYQMPIKSGLDFLKELRDKGNNVPFILFTGKGREEVAVKALNLGVDRYFNKIGHPETVYGELAHGIRQAAIQRRAEKKIWDREERLRAIIASSPDAMIVTDLHGNLSDCNFETLKLLGVSSKKEIMGEDCYNFIARTEIQTMKKTVQTLLEHGSVINIETKLLSKNGFSIDVEFSANTLRDAYGKPIGAVVLARNITDEKKMQQALKDSEEQYRNLVEMSPDGMISLDSKGIVTAVNRGIMTQTGYEKSDFVGKHFTQLAVIPEENLVELTEKINSFLKGDIPASFEVYYNRKDGKQFCSEATVGLLKNNNKFDGIQLLFRDITERKKNEEKHLASEKRFRDLAELLPEVIFEYDLKGNITYVNHEAYTRFGYSTEDFENGLNVLQFMSPECVDKAKTNIAKIVNGKRSRKHEEYKIIRKDGSTFPAIITAAPIIIENKIVGIRGVLVDISERKKIEQQLKDSEEKYHKQFEESLDAIVLADADTGIIIDCNRAASHLFGKTKAELVGKHQKILHPPEKIQNNFSRTFTAHREEKDGIALESKIVTKNGEIRNVIIKGSCIKLGERKVAQGLFRDITEHKKAKASLIKERNALEKVTGNLNTTLVMISKDLHILWTNKYLSNILGDVSGKLCHSALNRSDQICSGCKIKEVIETGKQAVFEMTVNNPEGLKWSGGPDLFLEITVIPIKDKNGNVTEVLELATDITKRKKAEEKLLDSEEKFRTISHSAQDSIVLLDEMGKITYWNPAAEKTFAYTKEEAVGKELHKFIAPERFYEDYTRGFNKFKKTGQGSAVGKTLELFAKRKDGTEFPIELSLSAFKNKGKWCATGIVRDITERRKAEEGFAKERETLEKVTGNLSASLAMISKDYRILWANDYTKHNMGDVTGKICYKSFSGVDQVCSGCPAEEVFKTGKQAVREHVVTNPKLGNIILSVTSIPIKDKNGNVTELLELAIDVTKQKKAENTIKETLEKMETINEKLGVIGKLTRHDTRNKLGTILNSIYLAKTKIEDKESALKHLENVDSAIEQIEKILEFSRIYEILGTQEKTAINVKKIIDEAFMLASQSYEIELTNKCENLTVQADSLLRQVFYNLIENSLKHGETVTKIKVNYEETKNGLKLVYSDDGVGISPNQKELIFNEGYGKGTGYGLYLIRKICNEYGWTIKENGKPGKGAQFVINIQK